MKRYRILFAVFFPLAGCTPPAPQTPQPGITRYAQEAKFEDVREDLVLAIQNRGLVVDHTSYINNMLERTGKDLGTPTKIYVDGQAFSFCSAVTSRKTMEADVHNIAYCPYSLVVYATLKEPNIVHVAYRRPRSAGSVASRNALAQVESLLDGIAREALNIEKR